MRIDTKIVLAAVLIAGTGSTALAGDNNSGDYHGGFVMSGSMDGVNPVYHSDWVPNVAHRGKANGSTAFGSANAGTAYGSADRGKAVGSTDGAFINGNFIPRGTSRAQVPLFHEED